MKWASKKCKNFNISNVAFFYQNKEKHLEVSLYYTYVPNILMIWSIVLEIECDRLKLIIMGHFCPFNPHPLHPTSSGFPKNYIFMGDHTPLPQWGGTTNKLWGVTDRTGGTKKLWGRLWHYRNQISLKSIFVCSANTFLKKFVLQFVWTLLGFVILEW